MERTGHNIVSWWSKTID